MTMLALAAPSKLCLFLLSLVSAIANPAGEYPNPACPCIDSSAVLAEKSNCRRADNSSGVLLIGDGTCLPLDYGANECSTYDEETISCASGDAPGFCSQSWCYVDRNKCRHASEQVFKSSVGFEGIFYSYSTCGASANAWFNHTTIEALSNKTLVVAIPELQWPRHYKEDSSSQLYEPESPEAHDESMPWKGWAIDYFNALVEGSNIQSFRLVHRSRGSLSKGYSSPYTQAVSDVSAGVADLAISAFWVTTERLAMAPYTIPIAEDPLYLWIRRPKIEETNSLDDSARKIFLPFSTDLWLAILGTILAFGVGTVLVSPDRHREFDKEATTVLGKAKHASIILTDAFNTAFLEFLGRGVDHRSGANSSQKLLNIGFAFSIFISATAYTANMAAFLTLAHDNSHWTSIEYAIAANARICAPSPFKEELELMYPKANWIFPPGGTIAAMEAYEQGKCQAVVFGWFGTKGDPNRQDWVCENQMVRVGHPIYRDNVAFPVSKDLQAGLSHWISEAASKGITLDSFLLQHEPACDLDVILTAEHAEGSGLQQLTPKHMMLPLLLFLLASAMALTMHLIKVLQRAAHGESGSLASGAIEEQHPMPSRDPPEKPKDSHQQGDSKKEVVEQLLAQQQDLIQRCQQQQALLQNLVRLGSIENTLEC